LLQPHPLFHFCKSGIDVVIDSLFVAAARGSGTTCALVREDAEVKRAENNDLWQRTVGGRQQTGKGDDLRQRTEGDK
jgi:hypothetical protein